MDARSAQNPTDSKWYFGFVRNSWQSQRMIERDLAPYILKAARSFPAVTLTGPRQSRPD